MYWTARSTFSYRSLGVYGAVFSPDATLVALAHGSVVTLWDTQSNLLLRALESGVDARKVTFTSTEGRYLVTGGAQKGVAVYDLLSCNVLQSLPLQACDVLIPLPTGFIATQSTATATTLSFFNPEGTPSRTISLKSAFSVLASLPSTATHLVGIAPTGEIYRFGDMQASAAPAARSVASAAAPARRATSIWQEMFGKDAFLDDLELAPEPEAAAVAVSALQRRAAGHPEHVFDGPSHTLPPVGMLFEAFMDELLVSQDETTAEADENAIDIDAVPAITAAPFTMSSDAVRVVRDDEVSQLEVFFRDLLSSAPKKTVAKTPSKPKKVNGIANGHRSVSTPTKTQSSAVSTPGDEPEVVDGKKKSKKRKAPRTSEI